VNKQERAEMNRLTKQHTKDRAAWHNEKQRLQARTHTGINQLTNEWPDLPDLLQILTEIHEASTPGHATITDTTRSPNHDYITPDGRTLKEGASTAKARGTKGWATKQLAALVKRLENSMDPDRIREEKPRCGRNTCTGQWKRQPYGVTICGFCGEPIKQPPKQVASGNGKKPTTI